MQTDNDQDNSKIDESVESDQDENVENANEEKTIEDGVFTLTLSKSTTGSSENKDENQNDVVIETKPQHNKTNPHPRRSSYIQFHKGLLYLYGGRFDDKEETEITFNDMYSLNMKKLDEWKIIYEDPEFKTELKKADDLSSSFFFAFILIFKIVEYNKFFFKMSRIQTRVAMNQMKIRKWKSMRLKSKEMKLWKLTLKEQKISGQQKQPKNFQMKNLKRC